MVNIRDVAVDAGVSRSTVSYVLSGNRKISSETAERVRASVVKLGYRPDPMARALALKRTNILGFLASVDTESHEADVEVFMRFVRAAMYAARARGFDLLVMGRGEDELRGDVLADALVVMDIALDDPRLPVLKSMGLPTVLIGIPEDSAGLSAIDLDFDEAGRAAARHLAELGHTRIAFLSQAHQGVDVGLNFAVRLQRGFEDECHKLGVESMIRPSDTNREAVRLWLQEAQSALPGFTAIFSHSPGPLEFLFDDFEAAGITVPGDLSVMTVAPEAAMRALRHPVTVIDLPGQLMVEGAVNRVLDELSGQAPGVVELLPAYVIDLGSTAAPSRTTEPSPDLG